ncbi:MAG TPA: ABC transporter permease [Chthoniobacterales bacterium]|nr:ABC transporter permease [Chthoniobacterales bacterium]
MNNLRFALLQLRKSPGFTAIAVLTLALGIGLNTTVFSLINDLFFRGLPFVEPHRIARMYAEDKGRGLVNFPLSAPRFMHYRDGQTIFGGFAAQTGAALTLSGIGDPVQVSGFRVTANYFDVIGVRPIRGRTFWPTEEEGADVVIVSKNFWQSRLGGEPDVLGRSITLDGVPHTIIGVVPNMPVTWVGPNRNEVWITKPFAIPGFSYERMMRGTAFLRVIGRLKPGETIDQARAALPSLDESYRAQYPDKIDAKFVTTVKTLPEDLTGDLRPTFVTLLAAVGFVLLIACSNVANLFLVRFSGRRREIALRLALGAPRASVVRLFVFESLFVSAIAAVVGAILAWRLVPLVPKMASDFLPLEANRVTGLSAQVLCFTIALSLLAGLVIGVYPAWQSSRADLVGGLREGGRGTSASAHQQRFRKILVGVQVALSMTLLAGAGLLIVSFVQLSHQDTGFRGENLWVGFVTFPQTAYPDSSSRKRFVEKALNVLRAVSGFESVSVSGDFPLGSDNATTLYARTDREMPPIMQRASAPAHQVAPGYFQTWGIPILSGRDFDEHDVEDRQNVILISHAGARKVFGEENPIGKTLLVTALSVPVEIIGVVGDVRSDRIAQPSEMEFYRPWAQENFPFMAIAIRSKFKTEAVTRLVQSAINGIDSGIAIAQPRSMDTIVAQALGQSRLMMALLSVFACVALLLAGVGIYGAVAYTVVQRTGEIGVRMALGAQTTDVLRLVVSQGMKPVVVGLIAGLLAALALGRLLTSQLYQVSAYNPLLLSATVAILGAGALLACLVPACRAALVNPIQALRSD